MRENLAYQEDLREELINGEIVMMSPRPAYNHNRVASNIFWVFESYLRGKRCTPIADGTDLYLTEENRFVPGSASKFVSPTANGISYPVRSLFSISGLI